MTVLIDVPLVSLEGNICRAWSLDPTQPIVVSICFNSQFYRGTPRPPVEKV